MKMPKAVKRYCPYCKKHADHSVYTSKKKAPRSMSHGSKFRARKRGRARGMGSMGRYSKPAITKWKMTGKKPTKKLDLRFECKSCKKAHIKRKGKRAKRIEFV